MAFQIPQIHTALPASQTQIPVRESQIIRQVAEEKSMSTVGTQKELPTTVDEVLENIERIGPVKLSLPIYKLLELRQIAKNLGIPRVSNAKKDDLSLRIRAFVNERKLI